MAKILIKGGSVITMERGADDLPVGDVLVDGAKIAQVAPRIDAADGAEIIDAKGMIVMPGLVNSHIHTWQTGLRGVASNWTATNYFRAMHAGLATYFKPEDIHIANLVGALNQINCGTTTIVDWHHNNPTPAHTDAAIDGLEQSGLRAVFLHGSPKPDPKPGQKPYSETPMPRGEVERLRKGRLSSDDALVTLGLAVLGPQMSVEEVTIADFRLAREFDLVASLHHSGKNMIAPNGYQRAAKEGLLGPRINIVHGNELTDADLKVLLEHGATFVVTAEVELQLCYTDLLSGRLRTHGTPFAVGSDIECAYGSDMFTVMRTTLQAERHLTSMRVLAECGARPHPIPITTREALGWASVEGARIFRLGKVGSLAPGKDADIILVRATDLNMVAANDPVNAIVAYANPGNVDTVLIAGKVMKRGGRLLAGELPRLGEKLAESGRRIFSDFRRTAHTAEFA